MEMDITKSEIELLSSFRSGLKQYLTNSHFFCEMFNLSETQYLLLLHLKALQARGEASYLILKERMHINSATLTLLIKRSEKSGYLEPLGTSRVTYEQVIKLSEAGNKLVKALVIMHKREYESLQQRLLKNGCSNHCTSPVCWKGTD